jgi:hypothetical protein
MSFVVQDQARHLFPRDGGSVANADAERRRATMGEVSIEALRLSRTKRGVDVGDRLRD